MYRKRIDELLIQYRSATTAVKMEALHLAGAEKEVTDTEEAQHIIQTVAQSVQQVVHNRIAGIVSSCLETIFDTPYQFRIEFDRKRGRTEARLLFVRDGEEIDPISASGGGVVDVTAFALRLACLILTRPAVRRLIVLDEPFKHLSAEYRVRVRSMLEGLAEQMDTQIILVTHSTEFHIGKVVEVG